MMRCQAQSGNNRAPLHRTSRVGQTLCFGPPEWHHELGIFGQSWSALLPSASSARKWDGSSFYICQLFNCGFKIVSGVPLLSRFRLVNMTFPSGLTSHISTLRVVCGDILKANPLSEATWAFHPASFLTVRFKAFSIHEKNLPSLRVDGNGRRGVAPDASLFFLLLIYVTIKIFSGSVNWDLLPDCGNFWWLVQKSAEGSSPCWEVNNCCESLLTSVLLPLSKGKSFRFKSQ